MDVFSLNAAEEEEFPDIQTTDQPDVSFFFSQDSLRVLCDHLPDSVLPSWWLLQRLASVLRPLPTEVSARYPERCCQTREAQENTRFCVMIVFICVIVFKNRTEHICGSRPLNVKMMLVFLFYVIFILQFCHSLKLLDKTFTTVTHNFEVLVLWVLPFYAILHV